MRTGWRFCGDVASPRWSGRDRSRDGEHLRGRMLRSELAGDQDEEMQKESGD